MHPRNHRQINGAGSGVQQGFGAGIGGGPCGQHIVHQKDAAALDLFGPRGRHAKCAAHIGFATAKGLAALTLGGADAFEAVGQIGQAALSGQGAGNLGALVKAALQEARGVERHRHHRIAVEDERIGGAAEPAGKQLGMGLLIAVFEAKDQAARMLVIDAGRAGA